MKHLGLFEGIGGFSLAASWAGWETVAWCEWNGFGQKVLRHHFPNAEGHGDITKTDFTKYKNAIDIITGGFPCQPYSTAGKRKGKEDERHLWPEMLRAIREVSPRYVVGENVRGLTNWTGGMVFDEVQADLEAQGFEVLPFLLPACAKGADHRRDRIWFVAYNDNGRGQEHKLCAGRDVLKSGVTKTGINTNVSGEGLQVGIQSGFRSLQSQAGTRPGSERSRIFAEDYWAEFPTQSPIFSRDDGFSRGLDGITVSKWRSESIKAYGNAIVPQVAYEIFKAINACGGIF
jgi:DNA (cytosine-5)-methyltransferase 1